MIPEMIHIAPSTANRAVAAAVTASATVIRILRPSVARMSDSFFERWLRTTINFSLREGERDAALRGSTASPNRG
jgi:hypothetical protein